MEVTEVHNNDPVVREVRMLQTASVLESLSIISGIDADNILDRFEKILREQHTSWNKEVRTIIGENILNNIFNEEDN